jgi:MoaA/NifB/PqqE/SkfB family radical SAM enzyme
MVDILKENKLGRLTITGGEPTILGDELHDFLIYVHNQQIHTCLTTTGFRLTKEKIEQLDEYLDQLMISIRSLNRDDWVKEYGDTKHTSMLFDCAMNVLNWTKSTSIILEVCTVLHKENIGKVIDIGWQLLSINPNIVWRVDEYYSMGIKEKEKSRFEIDSLEFESIRSRIIKTFEKSFKGLRFTTVAQREKSQEYFITHTGELVTSYNHTHLPTGLNLLHNQLPSEFKMLRNWDELKKVCRDWGWENF